MGKRKTRNQVRVCAAIHTKDDECLKQGRSVRMERKETGSGEAGLAGIHH